MACKVTYIRRFGLIALADIFNLAPFVSRAATAVFQEFVLEPLFFILPGFALSLIAEVGYLSRLVFGDITLFMELRYNLPRVILDTWFFQLLWAFG